MIIKCGRRTFEVTSKDRILDNGTCYILITQKYFKDWSYINPHIAKTTFEKMFREGKIKKSKAVYKGINNTYDLYEFVE